MPSANTPDLSFLEAITRQAGDLTLRTFRNHAKPAEKEHHQGFVTEADLASEKLILARINGSFPSHSVLAEESGQSGSDQDLQGPLWLIDPLDGTNNFAHGNPYYCVSVAYGLRDGTTCDVRLAAIHHPASGDLFTAEKGKGAWRNGEPIRTSSQSEFRLGSYCTGFGSNHGEDLKRNLEQIGRVQENCISTAVRVNGAAALDLAYTAFGIYEGFWETRLSPWDTAAGSLLIREAGGVLTNLAGEAFDPLRDRGIVCGAAKIQPRLLEIIT